MAERQIPNTSRVPVGPDGVLPEDVFPRVFGSYLLLKVFARGGMGEVLLARQVSSSGLDRYCVVKKLRKELTRDREYVTRFIDEARVVVHLDHPNICRTFDVGRVAEEYYLAMEYVSGCDVRMIQDKARVGSAPMSADTVLPIACELLEALDHAHQRRDQNGELLRLVHRDISPQNVMISYDGEVKLIDFGLASSKLKMEKTQPNVVMGKMAYMSPEQARGDNIDHTADLFAVGVMTYELLANERFYEGMATHEIWQVVGRGGFVPRRWRELDPKLQGIVGRALHPDHTQRYPSCGAFRDALNDYLAAHYPQAGRATVRAVIEEMFLDEISLERKVLAGFADTTIGDLKEDLEKSRSQSVSLVTSDAKAESPVSLMGAGEQNNDASVVERDLGPVPTDLVDAKTPPTGTHPDSFASVPDRSPSPQIHEERTVLHEHTEFVPRAAPPRHEATQLIRADQFRVPPAATKKPKRSLVLVAALCAVAVVALLGVIALLLLNPGPSTPKLSSPEVAVGAIPRGNDLNLTLAPEVVPVPEAATPEQPAPSVATPAVTSPDVTTPETKSPEAAAPEAASPPSPDVTAPEAATPEAATPEAVGEADVRKTTSPKARGRRRARTRKAGRATAAKTKAKTKAKTNTATETKTKKAAEPTEAERAKAAAAERKKNLKLFFTATQVLDSKGYSSSDMYSTPLKRAAVLAQSSAAGAGEAFLAKAKRTSSVQNLFKKAASTCNQNDNPCFGDVKVLYIQFAQKKTTPKQSANFVRKLRSCLASCR